jgi:hypothetical protein
MNFEKEEFFSTDCMYLAPDQWQCYDVGRDKIKNITFIFEVGIDFNEPHIGPLFSLRQFK